MAMTTETVWAALDSLLDYGKNCGLLHPLDETFARNTLLSQLGLESYEKQEQHFDFPECLKLLCDYAAQEGLIADTVAERERALLAAYAALLGKFPAVHILGAPRSRAGALSFTVEGASAFDVAVLLDKLGVAVRSGHHCARPLLRRLGADYAVRISPAFYNTFDELEAVEAALRRVFGVLGVR